MVGTVGLEPTRDFSQRILSPLRLPIPPRPHHLWRFRSDLTDDHRVAVYCLTTWLRNHFVDCPNIIPQRIIKSKKKINFYIFLKTVHFLFLVELI